MKFLRLRIANYRGVVVSEVKFSPIGITLVQGPNEAGKSSLGEAISLLFEFPDSSKSRSIEAIRPVHRDQGPEIELVAESGPYSFTYFKRFYKKPETRLTITHPSPENHTGREAHDRADEILRETLDLNLWRALTIQQGEAIGQPTLKNQTSLSAALDKAAGGYSVNPREEGLFEKVREEYLRYYTEKRGERKELSDSRKKEAEAKQEVQKFKDAIADLEQDIDRAGVLRREIEDLKNSETELRGQVTSYSKSLEEIEELESALSEARLKLETAKKTEEMNLKNKEIRQGLIEKGQNVQEEMKSTEDTGTESLEALNKAEYDLKGARKNYEDINAKRTESDLLAKLRRADFDHFNNKLHLEQLQERKGRIDQAREEALQAEEILEKSKVDEKVLKTILDAERTLLTANARLETGAPSVIIRGIADNLLSIDGSEVEISKGQEKSYAVANRLNLALPDLIEIEITAGSNTENFVTIQHNLFETSKKFVSRALFS